MAGTASAAEITVVSGGAVEPGPTGDPGEEAGRFGAGIILHTGAPPMLRPLIS